MIDRDLAISVQSVSKRYRIGLLEAQHETFGAQLFHWIMYPFKNFKRLWRLSSFKKGENELDIHWALRDINFSVKKGQVIGVIGKNGAGKSTLLKILSKITNPTTGEVLIKGRVSSLLEVGTGFHPDLTGRDNIYMNGTILGMTRKEIDKKLQQIIDFSGVRKYIDTPVKRYSSGMRVRLAFSVAAHLEPDVLIIDEVLAVGDAEFQKKCLGKMEDVAGQGRTVLFVSHNMASIKNLCQEVIVLHEGGLDFHGSVTEGIKRYLGSFSKTDREGIIPDEARSFNSGDAKITTVKILNPQTSQEVEVHYNDPIKVQLKIDSNREIKDCMIDIRIGSSDGVEVGYWASKLNRGPQLDISSGQQSFIVQLDNPLQPGNYFLTLGMHFGDGRTIDFVENIIRFRVNNFSLDKSYSYPFKWVPGQFRIPGELEIAG